MIDLYFWTTPNGYKISIFLEEANLPYHLIPVDIGAGDQFKPEFLKISPNNKIPAIVDHKPDDDGKPVSIFESGAILLYLAEKSGRFLPEEQRMRSQVTEWLMWQMAGFGPMLGQNHHFRQYAPEKIGYAIERYRLESERLYGVLEERLEGRDYVAGDYSIADMAIYPWVVSHEKQGIDLNDFPHIKRWFDLIRHRPAVIRAYARGQEMNSQPTVNDRSRAVLFGQGRRKK
jgi:GST-like protein